jgi:hypothetical protein
MRRIDNLKIGTEIVLRFHEGSGYHDERGIFLGIEGTGEDRRARFETDNATPNFGSLSGAYSWSAYRSTNNKFWAYGSSEQRLQLIEIISEPS